MSQVNPPGKGSPHVRQAAFHHPARAAAVAPQVAWNDPSQRMPLLILGGLVVLLVLAYWDMFTITSGEWSDPLYSHGWIVPVFALGLMWIRWEPFGPVPAAERWLGLLLLAGGLSFRLVGTYFSSNPIDQLSFLPSIFGVFMLVGGFNVIRWAGPALGFLVLMFPLPSFLERAIHLRLQTLASMASTFVLQTMGIAAYRQGNVINIAGLDMPLTVAEACSGLRMLTIFVALAVAMVFLVERPWWDKLIILLSSVPIALIVNIIRITVTGLAYLWFGQDSEFVKKLAHDYAGYFMMPMALGLLWIELQILERLTIPVETAQLRPIGGGRGVAIPVR
jgi:exosortase